MLESIVVARGLSKYFGDRLVLEDVSCSVERGDIVGVLGKNAAGKTTLLELMLGFTPPSAGRVEVYGQDSFRMTSAVKARIGFVPQQDELINQLSVADQLRLIRSFYSNWDDALIDRLMTDWELERNERIKNLSVGQRQKLSILLALGHSPEFLVLDEPVASLDPIARRRFLEQLVEISVDGNRAIVFSSHIVSDIERLANKIWIIKGSRLHWSGDVDALRESVLRLHIRAAGPLPGNLVIPNALSVQLMDRYATAVVHGWDDELGRIVTNATGASLELEPLGLEEIFLELHR